MPDQRHENGHAIERATANPPAGRDEAAGLDTKHSIQHDPAPTPSPRLSEESDVPWPFDTDSSVNEEDASLGGGTRTRLLASKTLTIIGIRVNTLRTRFRRAFHMRSGYRDGYGDDVRIQPIIESCMM